MGEDARRKKRRAPAKGRAPPHRQKSDIEPADLARQVRRAYADQLAGRPLSKPAHRDALRVANGLALIQQLIKKECNEAKARGDLAAFYECGLREAAEIMEALTTGKNHPIWRYVDGMKAAGLKLQNPSPSGTERQRRAILLVFVEAYRISHEPPIARLAAEQAIAGYFNGWNDIQLKASMLSGWRRCLSKEDRDCADAAARSVITDADRKVKIRRSVARKIKGSLLPYKVLGLADQYVRASFGVAQ